MRIIIIIITIFISNIYTFTNVYTIKALRSRCQDHSILYL